MAGSKYLTFALLAFLAAYYVFPPLQRLATCIGYFRTPGRTEVAEGDFVIIDDTVHCEDVHYYEPSGLLFTACDDVEETRFRWFPPMAVFKDPDMGSRTRGSIHVIDPRTMKSRRLKFENFEGTFITHGIDVISDPADDQAVYVFAVNHPPHPDYLAFHMASAKDGAQQKKPEFTGPKASSRVEIFHHVLGAPTIRHLRTVQHPLIQTPNDILATSPAAFFVTNDHHYREGLLRDLEEVYFGAAWTTTVHVLLDSASLTPGASAHAAAERNATTGVDAVHAITGMHNNNGLGHGQPGQALVVSCISATLHVGELPSPANASDRAIRVRESIRVESIIDNPSYFRDPAPPSPGQDATGYVLAGPTRGVDMPKALHAGDVQTMHEAIGVMVWYVRPARGSQREGERAPWEHRLVFEDDGKRISTASAAVMVLADEAKEVGGERKAWLFVTGFMSRNMVAVKVDL